MNNKIFIDFNIDLQGNAKISGNKNKLWTQAYVLNTQRTSQYVKVTNLPQGDRVLQKDLSKIKSFFRTKLVSNFDGLMGARNV